MYVFQNIAIKHKLMLIIMLTCITGLVLAGTAFICWEWNTFRSQMVYNLSTQTEMIAENCKAALTFQDSDDAKETLQALRVEPSIVFGCVYNKDGRPFAIYYRSYASIEVHPSKLQENGFRFSDGFLTVFRPIVLEGEIIGTVCLRSDMSPMYEMLKRNTTTIIVVLFASSLVVLLMSSRLQKVISEPILRLAKVAKAVSEKKDYSTRVLKHGNDEVGLLIDSFNEMLEQIQRRDLELVGTKERLEVRVEERTTELRKANYQLQQEIVVREKAEEELRKAEENYRTQFEGALDAIFVADAETGIIIDCNPAGTKLVGREKSELIGKSHKILHPPERIDGEFSDTFRQHLKGKQGQTLETQVITKTGQIRDVAIKATLLEVGGRKVLQGIFRDITERKQVEEKMRQAKEYAELLIKVIPSCLFTVDKNRCITSWNKKAEEITGYSAEEVLGKECRLFAEAPCKDKCGLYSDDVKKPVIAKECTIIKKDGQEIFISKNVDELRDEKGNVIGGIESFEDITDRKEAEVKQIELIEKIESINKELKDFAHIVSHDLKAPLRGIKSLAEWIASDYSGKIDENGKKQMGLLTSRVDRMQNLIDGILQYSKVGRTEEEKTVVNLNELLPEVIDLISPPENISVTIENELPVIECECTRISQVFQNLLSNAIKYMDKEQGIIKVGCVQEGGFWKFSVSDNGLGIEEKHFEKIFQIFQKLQPGEDVEGAGVGLSVVKKIIDLNGGKIWVESKIGKGSTFFFTVPQVERSQEITS